MASDTTTITVPTALVEAVREASCNRVPPWPEHRRYGMCAAQTEALAGMLDAILSAPPAPAQPDLDALEAAMRDATPGPWTRVDLASHSRVLGDGWCVADCCARSCGASLAAARAIVAAVNAAPLLVAEVRRLRAATEAMRAWGEARRVEAGAITAHEAVRHIVGPGRTATRAARDAAQHACRRAFDAACAEADSLAAQGVPRG